MLAFFVAILSTCRSNYVLNPGRSRTEASLQVACFRWQCHILVVLLALPALALGQENCDNALIRNQGAVKTTQHSTNSPDCVKFVEENKIVSFRGICKRFRFFQ